VLKRKELSKINYRPGVGTAHPISVEERENNVAILDCNINLILATASTSSGNDDDADDIDANVYYYRNVYTTCRFKMGRSPK
jgi:hypothetical protein